MGNYVLALDQGTTSSRAILFDKHGNIVTKAQYEFNQIYPHPGWVEHNPMEILYSQFQAVTDVITQKKVISSDIAAIGITNQRETTILWDKGTGKPIYNAIVWQCRRTAEMCEEIKKDKELCDYIKEHTGLVVDAYFSATKIKWVLENVPGARILADAGQLLFGTVETWLIWNLTGGQVHVTDYSNASRTMLFDVDKLEWDPYLCEKLDIPMSILPEVKPSSEVYGTVAPGLLGFEDIVGTPISGAIGDQPAALFGQGCFKTGQAKNTYGTGCFLLMNTGENRVKSKNNLVTGVAWGLDGKVNYAIEGSAFNAGSVIKWLRDDLRLIDSARRCDELAESVDDANGIYFVPAFTGIKLSELRVDGGASVSNIMMQIQANLIRTKVNRPKVVETTALGAAYLAGLAVGFWKDLDEIETIREVDKIFEPQMPLVKRDEIYHGWLRAVERSRDWIEH